MPVNVVLLLVVACSLSPFVMSLCVPALPAMRDELGVGDAEIQWVISGFLLTLAVSQPLHGVLTDRIGRRPVLIAGFCVAILGSVIASQAGGLLTLILARIVQGAGIATGTVVARAMIRDVAGGDEGAKIMSYLSIGMGVSPTLAPLISGFLVQTSGWRLCFHVAAAACAMVLVWIVLSLPETGAKAERLEESHSGNLLRDIATVAGSRVFWGYALMFGFGNAAFFAFLTIGPSFFADILGKGPAQFGMYMGGLAACYVAGASCAAHWIPRLGMEAVLRLGLVGTAISAILLILSGALLEASVLSVMLPMILLFFAAGAVNPGAMSGAVWYFPRQAGTASGLSSSVGMGLAALGAIVSAQFIGNDMLSLAVPMAISIFLSVAAYGLVLSSPRPLTER